jgi:ATP-binding cassette subfamily F protein uup
LRVLEEALIAFTGVTCVVSHDRYFLNRVCTDILAFEGDGKIHHSVGDYDYYLEKKAKVAAAAARQSAAILETNKAAQAKEASASKSKPRKLSFKETRELEGIEAEIHKVEAEVARIEALFADPEFFRKQSAKVNELTIELEAAKETVTKLYARWEELEAIRAASVTANAG